MALKGDLASVDLAQVFQMLALNQKVGMLCISSPKGWRALYFEPRGACLYFDEHVLLDKVVLQATRTGHLVPEAVREARQHAASQGMGLADALIAGGFLGETELTAMLRSEMEEEIYDLFFWTEAHFEFYEGATTVEGREGRVDPRFVFSTDTLIMEAARRIDEWSFIQERIAGPLEIFRPVGNAANILALEDSALALYDLVDGKRNVARLIEITGLPPFLVYKGLAVLLEEGLVEAVPGEELLATAEECEHEGRYQDAINLYEKAVSLGEGIPESHRRAAAVYETLQEFELAAYHHKCVAEFAAQADDVRGAVEMLKHVVEVLPTDLAARERLVELTVGRPDLATRDFDPTANGKALVDLYLGIGEVERVRGILERLLRDNPFDLELKKSLVNVHSKAGDSKRVVELYESIAEDLVQERKPLEAIKYLQKILMLDRNRKDISERIRSLYVLDERRRNRRRSVFALCAMFVLLAAFGVVWWFYNDHAGERWLTVQGRVEKLLEKRDYENALAELGGFLGEIPFTLVAEDVTVEVSRIESMKLKEDERIAQLKRRKDEDLARLRDDYREGWAEYGRLVPLGDLDAALRQLEKVKAMVDEAGEEEDRQWAKDKKVALDTNLDRMRSYISKALELSRRAREEMRAGNWRQARELWLELVKSYEMSETARVARLPVMIRSRPEGAQLLRDGVPVVEDGGAAARTPMVVLCGHGGPETFELRLDGFAPQQITLDALENAEVERVLEAIPVRGIRLSDPVRGAVSVGRGFLAAGVRGGKVAIVRLEDGTTTTTYQIPGFDELDGKAVLTTATVVFSTGDGVITAVSLANGEVSWTYRAKARPLYDLLVGNGRLFFVDERSRLIALDASKGGEPLWFMALPAEPAGPPTAFGRRLVLAVRTGEILVLDAFEGDVVERLQTGARLVTPATVTDGAYVVGADDGRVIAIRKDTGRPAWERPLDGGAIPERIVAAGDSLLVRASDGSLVQLGRLDGEVEGRVVGKGRIVAGPEISDGRVVVAIRGKETDADLLRVYRLGDLELLWEFRDGGQFTADVLTSGSAIFVPDSKGEVLEFR